MEDSKSLKEAWDSNSMTKNWIPCLDMQGNQIDKKPIMFCSMRCNKIDQCGSFLLYHDAIKLLREQVLKQKNPALIPGFNKFIDSITDHVGKENIPEGIKIIKGDQAEDETGESEDENGGSETENGKSEDENGEPETENGNGPEDNEDDTEGQDDKTETPEEKKGAEDTSKKKTVKKKKTKRKAKRNVKEEPEDKTQNSEPENKTVEVKDTDRYAILPLHVTDIEARGFVKKSQLNSLLSKFKEEGIECSVFKLGKDINKKSEYDYLVAPLEADHPKMVNNEELQDIIEEFTENNIQVRIFKIGKELRARKQIIIEEV